MLASIEGSMKAKLRKAKMDEEMLLEPRVYRKGADAKHKQNRSNRASTELSTPLNLLSRKQSSSLPQEDHQGSQTLATDPFSPPSPIVKSTIQNPNTNSTHLPNAATRTKQINFSKFMQKKVFSPKQVLLSIEQKKQNDIKLA